MKFYQSLMGAAFGVLLAAGAAMAAPESTRVGPPETKIVGDWMVRCFPVSSPSPCDLYQELDNTKSRQRLMAISIAYIPSRDRHAVQITVPLEVSIPKGLVIMTDSFTSPPLRYRRCDRNGCYVEMPIDNASIAALSKSGPDAKIRVFADGGKYFDLRFSLKGFSAAHDDMAAQARAKAKPMPNPADAAPAP